MHYLNILTCVIFLNHFGLLGQQKPLTEIKFKNLALQIEFMENNKEPIHLPSLNNLPLEKVVIYEDRYWLRAISPDNSFLDFAGELNPHGTSSPGTSIVLGGLNAILQKLQE